MLLFELPCWYYQLAIICAGGAVYLIINHVANEMPTHSCPVLPNMVLVTCSGLSMCLCCRLKC